MESTAESLFDLRAPTGGELFKDDRGEAPAPQRALITVSPEWFAGRLQEAFKKRVDALSEIVASTTVETQEVADQLINSRAEAKSLIKQVDDLLKTHISETEATIKKIRATAKGYTSKLDGLIQIINDKLIAWSRLKEIRERELERQRQEDIAAMNEKIRAEAEAAGIEAPAPITVPAAIKADAVQRTATGAKASVFKRWTYNKDTVDIKAVAAAVAKGKLPVTVLELNSGVVQKMIDGGTRTMPGIEIFEKERIRG